MKLSIFCGFLVLLFVFYLRPVKSQEAGEYSIYNYSVNEGLSQSTVYSILQHSHGFIWFGTRGGGLNRFDGYDFKNYKSSYNEPSTLSGNEVISIYEDKKRNFWVGNRSNGLDRFDWATEKFIHYNVRRNSNEPFAVNDFYEDNNEKLWIATSAGIYYYEAVADSFVFYDLFPSIPVSSIDRNEAGNMIFGTKEGIFSLNTNTGNFKRNIPLNFQVTQKGMVWNLPVLVDSKQNLWFGTLAGLFLVTDLENGKFLENPFKIPELYNIHPRSIAEDSNGQIWVGTEHGLIKIDPNTGSYILFRHNDNDPETICHNSVHSILEDSAGNLWIGTWGGISMFSKQAKKFKHVMHIAYSNSLSNNIVSSFEESEKGLWIGTEAGGLNFFDNNTHLFNSFRKNDNSGLKSDNVKCLLLDSDGVLWVGTWRKGLYRLNETTGSFDNFLSDQNVFCLTKDLNGNLWIGTLDGLYKFNRYSETFKLYSPENYSGLNDYFVTSLFCDNRGNIWVGTKQGGLHLYNLQTDRFIAFTNDKNDNSGLIDNYIISINQDEKGSLWIGTNNGICLYDYNSGKFEDFSHKMKLPDNVINGIVPDKNSTLWISTNQGLSRYNVETGELRNYDSRDGLQSNEFNRGAFFKRSNGEVLFGGINGYSSFFPENVKDNTIIPKVILTDFKLFNNTVIPNSDNSPLTKHISETDNITLKYNQSFFTFEFVALNFVMSEKNQYKYKLAGYNNDWMVLGNERKVSFMNLRNGDYTLKIIASNNDEVWNTEGISVNITILPPIWRTGWAYLAYFIIIGLIVLFLQNQISSRIRQKNAILNERLEKERNEELNQMKLSFFTNITHEFRTPLTLISAPLDNLISEDVPFERKEYYYRLIKGNVRRLKRLVDQLLDFRKAEHERLKLKVTAMDIKEFIQSMGDNFFELARKKEIDFKVHVEEISEQVYFDPGKVDKIIFNLLSNAFKFTSSGGSIALHAGLEGRHLVINVTDTGIGISQQDIEHIFERFYSSSKKDNINNSGTGIGLSFSKKLAEIHKGTLNVTSEPNVKTTFTLSIPAFKEEYTKEEIIENENVEFVNENSAEFIELASIIEEEALDSKNTMLIVEDNQELSEYLRTQFSVNFMVMTASNGKEGYAIAREKMPDIIISDVMMNEMDGFELCRKVKNDFVTNHIPFVMLTALSGVENKISGIETGADAYIEKPFEFKYLDLVIHNLLNQRSILKEKYFLENRSLASFSENSMDSKFLLKIEKIVSDNLYNSEFNVNTLAAQLNMSRSQLFRKFKVLTESSPSDFIRIARIKKAAEMLLKEGGGIGINELAYEVGFASPSHFISCFKKYFGKTPKEYASAR